MIADMAAAMTKHENQLAALRLVMEFKSTGEFLSSSSKMLGSGQRDEAQDQGTWALVGASDKTITFTTKISIGTEERRFTFVDHDTIIEDLPDAPANMKLVLQRFNRIK